MILNKEDLIKQRQQLEIVLEYIKLSERLLDQQDQMRSAVDKIDDRNSIKLQLLKTDLGNILKNKEDQ